MKRIVITTALAIVACGCFRTTYSHLPVEGVQPPRASASTARRSVGSWQHFFVYGWAPSERVIDAAAVCGGAEHVERIETERSFAQGLVAAFAGYYINIYSPYTGRVVCDDTVGR